MFFDILPSSRRFVLHLKNLHEYIQLEKSCTTLNSGRYFFNRYTYLLQACPAGKSVAAKTDVIQWRGAAAQSFEYKETHGHFPLWIKSMYCGMPGYQIAMEPPNPIAINILHFVCILFLSKPLSFFFLLCISFLFFKPGFKN